jgi:uncharacterized protein YndB with AHSA1/START domain
LKTRVRLTNEMTDSNHYHLVTTWRVQGLPDEIYQVLDDPADLPRWWPAVYLSVRQVEPGDARGVGKVLDLHTQGWLPYTLRWQMRVVEKQPPERIVLEAQGDLSGRGVWTITRDNPWVDVTFDWQVEANKPGLRRWSWLLRPLFAANLRWAMARGEESLERELAFRQAKPETAAAIPPPPRPSNVTLFPLVVVLLGAVLAVLALLYYLVSRLLG